MSKPHQTNKHTGSSLEDFMKASEHTVPTHADATALKEPIVSKSTFANSDTNWCFSQTSATASECLDAAEQVRPHSNGLIEAFDKTVAKHADTFKRLAVSERLDTMNDVMAEVLHYLEHYEQSPFDNSSEMSAYIRERLNMPKPQEPDTAERLLRTWVEYFAGSETVKFSDLLERSQCLLEGIPTPHEVDSIMMSGATLKGTARLIDVAGQWSNGRTLQEIADSYNVTRERIRQMLCKFVRQNRTTVSQGNAE
jgi:hypothetical protein